MNKLKRLSFFLSASVILSSFLILSFVHTPSFPDSRTADYYLSPTGDDANDGSRWRPWRTFSKANSVAEPGWTIHVADGTYKVSSPGTGTTAAGIKTTKSGTAEARLRWVSDHKWGAKIVSSGYTWSPSDSLGSGANIAWYNTGSYVDIVGFDISGDGNLGIANDGSYVHILNNHVHNIVAPYACAGYIYGVAAIDNTDNIAAATANDVIGNWIDNIGSQTNRCAGGGHGVYQAILGGTVANNLIYRVQGYGVHMWHHSNAITVIYNTIFQGYGGVVIGASGGATNDHTFVSNNIIVDNQKFGMVESAGSGSAIGSHNVYSHNVISGNPYNTYSIISGSLLIGTINAPASTLFVNWQLDGSGNYHLKAGSPAIDAADRNYRISRDFDGVSRPQGPGYDIGAFEYLPAGT